MYFINRKYFVVPVLLAMFFAACSPKLASNRPLVIYPAPPDTTRIQYLTSYSNSLDISGKRSALQETVLGEDKGITIGKPYGLATVKGKIMICDATIAGIQIIDLSKKNFTPFIPTGKGKLKLPLNCFIDESGKLYVADGGRNEIVVFDEKQNYLTAIGNTDTADNFRPLDVCVSGDKIFVTNSKGGKVHIYSRTDYKLIKTIPDAADAGVVLYNPINITCGQGKIYVTDFGDFKIKIFNEEGRFTGSIGQYGKSLGQFVRPKGLAVDKEQNLYVVDAGFENVQLFNPDGKLLMYFGGPYKSPGDMWLPAKVHIDYSNLDYYRKWVAADYDLRYLIFVSNQYGPDKISVYAAVQPAGQAAAKKKK